METTNKLFYSGTKFFTENEEDYRITVRISVIRITGFQKMTNS